MDTAFPRKQLPSTVLEYDYKPLVSLNSFDFEVINDDEDENIRKKKFLLRLVKILHASGNLSFRTESVVQQVSDSLGLQCVCNLFPVLATLTFYAQPSNANSGSSMRNPSAAVPMRKHRSNATDTYSIRIKSKFSCSKLGALDNLCFDINKSIISFEEAEDILEDIDETLPRYGFYLIGLSYGLISFGCTVLMFGGAWLDGLWSFLFGLLVFMMGKLCEQYIGLSEVSCFLSSLMISFVATTLDRHVYDKSLCLYGQIMGGVTWLLPGSSITIALLEVYSQMIVYGASRLVYGTFIAMQLGFGLSVGFRLAIPSADSSPPSFEFGCKSPVEEWYGFILLPMISISLAIITDAERRQMVGIVLCTSIAQFTSYGLNKYRSHDMANNLLAASILTVAARLYCHFCNRYIKPVISPQISEDMNHAAAFGVEGGGVSGSGHSSSSIELRNNTPSPTLHVEEGIDTPITSSVLFGDSVYNTIKEDETLENGVFLSKENSDHQNNNPFSETDSQQQPYSSYQPSHFNANQQGNISMLQHGRIERSKERPLIYIVSGLFVLVPGGMGVKGMSNIWSGDYSGGMQFTFQMIMVGVCLAIGVFLALLPRKNWRIISKRHILKKIRHGANRRSFRSAPPR